MCFFIFVVVLGVDVLLEGLIMNKDVICMGVLLIYCDFFII